MNFFLVEYFPILIFLMISILLSCVVFGLSYFLGRQAGDVEKLSPYECGFDPFGDIRAKFDVRFYLVSILFIIFDLEVSFLFPWCLTLGQIGSFGFWVMFSFLFLLTIGFFYEWRKGALEWE
jgi:NADH-quinone oxidoreductase subunit A